MTAAHMGVAFLVAGATGASLLTQERIEAIPVNASVEVSGFEFTLTSVQRVAGPNYDALQGTFDVAEIGSGDPAATLIAETRQYVANGQVTTEAAIQSTLWYDLYAVLGDPAGQGRYTVRLYFKPLVPWLWIGSTLMVLGGLISLSDRRLRVGAPVRSRQQRTPEAAPAE